MGGPIGPPKFGGTIFGGTIFIKNIWGDQFQVPPNLGGPILSPPKFGGTSFRSPKFGVGAISGPPNLQQKVSFILPVPGFEAGNEDCQGVRLHEG